MQYRYTRFAYSSNVVEFSMDKICTTAAPSWATVSKDVGAFLHPSQLRTKPYLTYHEVLTLFRTGGEGKFAPQLVF